jgi:hypothetical protein
LKKIFIVCIAFIISGCVTNENRGTTPLSYEVQEIINPLVINPAIFKKIILISDTVDFSNRKNSESSLQEYSSTRSGSYLNYQMTGNVKNINLLVEFRYLPSSNEIRDVILDTDNAKITELLNQNNSFKKLVTKSFLNDFFQRELVTGTIILKDLSRELEDTIATFSDVSILEATAKYKVLGTSQIKGRLSVAVSLNSNIIMKDLITTESSIMKIVGNIFIDIKTGMVIESNSIESMTNGLSTSTISKSSLRLIKIID